MKQAPIRIMWLVAIMLVASVAHAADDGRLDPNVSPTFERVKLNLDASKTNYNGSVVIDLTVKEPTSTFRLHAEEMEFDKAELRRDKETIGIEFEPAGEDGLLQATTASKLAPGNYTLMIEFSKEYNTQGVGLYRTEYNGDGYLFTQFQAVDARKAFPCWDEPVYKIPFQLIVDIAEGQDVVTNTPVESETPLGGGRTVQFQKTQPLSTYLIAIAAGPLESVPITGLSVPGRVYTAKGQKHLAGTAVEMTPPILKALEEYFDRPYPYAKLDLIAVPEFWPGAMENAGLVTFADRLLLIDPDASSARQEGSLAYVTAHELAHMWFGDLVTMSWWDDLWLNESFATWMGGKVMNQVFPEYKRDLHALRSSQQVMVRDARPSTTPIRKPVKTSADIGEDLWLAYAKGEQVLGMVEQWIGPNAFREGVVEYINENAWKNAVGADLWTSLSTASGENVEATLGSFLDQSGFPMISVGETDGGVVISQQRFLNHGVEAPAQEWVVPVQLKYSTGSTIKTTTVLLDRESVVVETEGPVEWAMPNAGAHGYYRWSAPVDMLFRMAGEPGKTMDERERTAFLSNLSSLIDTGVIGGDDYLTILGEFAKYTEPEVTTALLTDLGKIESAFVPDELTDDFANYVRATLEPAKKKFGLKKTEGESEAISLLRPNLIAWLGENGRDPEVRQYATRLAKAYMSEPASIDASLASAALGIAAIEGDRELFDAYIERFETTEIPADRSRYLGALGAFTDPAVQEAALRYTLEGSLRPNEMFRIPRRMAQTPAGRDRVFEWMTANFDAIETRLPAEAMAYLPFLASSCSEERLVAAKAFFGEPAHQLGGAERNMVKVADQTTDCINLRAREGDAVAAYLSRLARASSK